MRFWIKRRSDVVAHLPWQTVVPVPKVYELSSLCVLWKPGLTVLWQSALISCSSWLSNFSRDGWREMVSLFRVKGSILSSWGLSRASPGDSTNIASTYQHAMTFTWSYHVYSTYSSRVVILLPLVCSFCFQLRKAFGIALEDKQLNHYLVK